MNSCCSPCGAATVDAEGRHLLRQRRRGMDTLERFERADHRVRAGEICAARVRAEFTLAREPGDDHAGEEAEHDLRDDDRDEVADAVCRARS